MQTEHKRWVDFEKCIICRTKKNHCSVHVLPQFEFLQSILPTLYCSSGVLAKCWMCPQIVKDRELCIETLSFCVRAQFKQKGLTRSVQLNKTNDGKWVLNYTVSLLPHHKTGIQYFSSEHRDNGHIWQSQSLMAKNNIWYPIYCAILGHLHQNGCARWSTSPLTANSKLCPPEMAFLWKFCWESLQEMLPKCPFNKPANQILTIWYIEQEFAKELLNVRSNIIQKTKKGKMTHSDGNYLSSLCNA